MESNAGLVGACGVCHEWHAEGEESRMGGRIDETMQVVHMVRVTS